MLKVIFFLVCSVSLFAQDEIVLKEKVELFINALESKDTNTLKNIMHPSCVIFSTLTKNGVPEIESIHKLSLMDYMRRAIKKKINFEEKLSDFEIKINDNLAVITTNYKMFAGKTLELKHCGINNFVLAKNKDSNWVFISIADTRKFENCD